MNRLLLRCCVPVLCAGLNPTLSAGAQSGPTTPPAATAPAPPGARAPYVPKNLKVLPDDTDLRKVMHGYSGDLGVECEFCHTAPDPVTKRPDRASDANPMKDRARYMIQMTDDLNMKYLAQMPNRHHDDDDDDAATAITCGTCHRGAKHPPIFVPPPRQEGNRPPGTPAAMPAPPMPHPDN